MRMNSSQIIQVIREASTYLGQDFDGFTLREMEASPRYYDREDAPEFRRDLIEAATKQRIIFLENQLAPEEIRSFLDDVEIPIFAFEETEDDLIPIIIFKEKRKLKVSRIRISDSETLSCDADYFPNLMLEDGKVSFMGIFGYKSLVSDDPENGENLKKLNPLQRLMRLLSEEKKDIFYIYIYAVLIGLISLTLPLGIQATVSLISGGVVFSSVYVLIALVIIGVFAAGGLQVMQITLVEFLQRRVFTKAAFEFAFRIPRIKNEALLNYYAPELMNRFFDVLTLQKGLPKLLIDLSAGVIQILFGLILLSLYHPFFVFFSLLLVGMLVLIFYFTGPKGLSSSIKESKYKYKVVYWLEELARTINSFKISGNTPLPIRKTDYNVNNYLKNRKVHFGVLVNQYIFILLFKGLVTGGLLIIGTILVVQREITLGQFVASEVIIILTLNSVEKIIMYMDVVYDMLTAVDKISQVTDLPLEKSGGIDIPKHLLERGMEVRVKKLSYKFPGSTDYVLKDVETHIRSGERICISGGAGSGRTVFTKVLTGLHQGYEGIITMDGYSLRDLDLTNLRDKIGKNVSQEDIFEGTIFENVLLSKPNSKAEDALWALDKVNVGDTINAMPEGLDTPMLSGGKGLSRGVVNKIILARCLAKRPSLLVLNDFFKDFIQSERLSLIQMLTAKEHNWTLIVVSNDPFIMAACDRVLLFEEGRITGNGKFDELVKSGALNKIVR
ncbi:peptidase domain-containing ABC transporter [Fulvivirga sedimenti]|uniref:ATP-binding cassette domain-containing protein n=1 Tax=Fulvivirga sedimenti TaxID=2879465 RepID=A0A9X1HR75_9BACT|nr:ATP-binding cassette domain-containing protein [Fulvivirga sedimenti]MCA6074737.1 ATP-binding cassette domain-containing protein [Fulvivirga sedimenti]MCA6075914.1 ATP-binding cassette domain-containing protein [Fulvivirga sedimenti]MCA6077042.1 ATP-binding cassette domain-containing protein [Fulvivirga sedimenti]